MAEKSPGSIDRQGDPFVHPVSVPPCLPVSFSAEVPPFVPSTPLPGGRNDQPASGQIQPDTDYPTVPGYQILAELGAGGMGIVYRARHVQLKRLTALKMIRTVHANRKTRERFVREAEAVARLQHPNIVQIYEVGECNGCPFLALEYLERGTLAGYLAGRPLEARQAARLIHTLAQAIQYAHDKGIIHRDLKPSNILLQGIDDFGLMIDDWRTIINPKIADFGLAKHLDEAAPLSREGDILGTPSYMAPEQAAGRTQEIGPRTDVYALGAILYELLTGRPPFLAGSAEATVKQVCEAEPVPPRQILPGRLPRDLDTICLKCLEKEPAKRYSSAAVLAEDLRRFLDGEAIAARPIGWAERAAKWTRRNPARATLLVCAVLAASAAAVAVPMHIHVLRTEVRQGQEEIQRLHRENLRERIQGLLTQGRKARGRNEWQDARMRFTEALDSLDGQGDGVDEDLRLRREEARAELSAVDRWLAEQKAAEERGRKYRELFRWRDEAFFLLRRNLFTPAAASPAESIAATDRGLALFNMAHDTTHDTALDGYNSAEKEEIRAGLFELLLIRAEAVAHPRGAGAWPPDPAPAGAPAPVGVPSPAPESRQIEQAGTALAILDRAARLSPDSSILHHRRARYLRQCGQSEAADREQRRADALPRRTALDWFLHGCDLGWEEAHRAQAIQAFEEALGRQGDLFWAHFFRALAYQKQGNPGEARASLTVCIDRRETFVWNYLLRGLLLIELGDLRAAKADFDKAESLPLDPAARYVLLLNRGTLALKERKEAEAVRAFRQAAREKPELYQAYVNLAEACGRQNQLSAAIGWLNEAIARQPADPNLYRSRALLEQRDHQPRAALDDLEQAIRLVPRGHASLELARFHFERGAILFLDDRFPDALRAFADSLDVEVQPVPSSRAAEADRLRASTHLLRAETLLKMEDHKAALAAFDDYLKKGAPTAHVWRMRAAAHLKAKDYKSVLEDCCKALGLERDAKTFCLRGCAYLHFDLPKLAVRDFDEALHLDPGSAEAFAWRGLARVKLGDVSRGVEDGRQAVKRSQKSAETRLWAARIFAQAEAVASRSAAAARSVDGTDYQAEALALLRQAAELIHDPAQEAAFWSGKVRYDPALSPIRSSAGFRALDQRFGRKRR
jgi:tetratricopeptide (TPR) repeat protein/tRNA A-37 threonylcarbamoyl transferase component Bud32